MVGHERRRYLRAAPEVGVRSREASGESNRDQVEAPTTPKMSIVNTKNAVETSASIETLLGRNRMFFTQLAGIQADPERH